MIDPITVFRAPIVGTDSVGQVMATLAAVAPEVADQLHADNDTRPYATVRHPGVLDILSFADWLTDGLARSPGTEFISRIDARSITEPAIEKREMILRFTSPTHFRAGSAEYLLPDPLMVFTDLVRKWEALDWPELRMHRLQRIGVPVLPALALDRHPINRGNPQPGFIGEIRFDLFGLDRPGERAAVWKLAKFGELRGVGAHTTYGMGRMIAR